MINSDTKQLIDEVVTLWVGQKRAFTGYRVSIEVQGRLRERGLPFLRHEEMGGYIRAGECRALQDAIAQGLYQITRRPMDADLRQANVYHPVGYDPAQYQPLPRHKGVGKLPSQEPASNMGSPNSATLAPSGVSVAKITHCSPARVKAVREITKINGAGDLWVSVLHVKQAGFQVGDMVELADANGVVKIQPPHGTGKTKRVEKHGNLRLSAKDRLLLGMNGSIFKVTSQIGRIEISV